MAVVVARAFHVLGLAPARHVASGLLRSASVTDFCSELSELHGEPIAGTAAEAKVWLAIEYCEPWEAKGVEKAAFPPAVRERLERVKTAK